LSPCRTRRNPQSSAESRWEAFDDPTS
jgi:hypothetical protein